MPKKIIRGFFLSMLTIMVFYACTSEQEPLLNNESLSIRLRWVPGTEIDTQQEAITGLSWALSQLGAMLPTGSLEKSVKWHEEHLFDLNILEVGLAPNSLFPFHSIIQRLKSSEEYVQTGAIDLGRFIMLSLNSPYHYYKIVAMPETLVEFRGLYVFNGDRVEVVNSSISISHRLIEIAEANSPLDIAFVAGETGEEFMEGFPFEAKEFETLSVMPNGQLRYGIYGQNGKLKVAASKDLTIAGKPAKCVWCHEINIQPLFLNNPVLENSRFLTAKEFNMRQHEQMISLTAYRLSLKTEIDFTQLQDHERVEELYEEFMEPTIERLMIEWQMSEMTIAQLLAGVPKHEHHEFGMVYYRKDVDGLGPYGVIRVSDSAREPSSFDPNFF